MKHPPHILTVLIVVGAVFLSAQPSSVVNPIQLQLRWDYYPTAEDEGHAVAFNVWESTAITTATDGWAFVGCTTDHTYTVTSDNPIDFWKVSSFWKQ